MKSNAIHTAKNQEVPTDYAKELSISAGKMPPNAVDFEKLVIGELLIDSGIIDKVIRRIGDKLDVFYDPRHLEIYKTIISLRDKSVPVDLMTVIQELKRNEKLNIAGGDHYIIDLTMGVSSGAHIDYHLLVILEKYIARKIINYSAHIIEKMYKESTDIFKDFDWLIEQNNEIEEIIASQKEVETSLELHQKFIKQQNEKIIPGIPSKYVDIQKRMSGHRNGTLEIIAARPAMGKTAYALDEAFYSARNGNAVAFVSLEMSAMELHQRMVSNELEINASALRDRLLSPNQIQMLYETNTFDKLPMYIVEGETVNFELNKILAKLRILKKEKGIKMAVIDYIQLIEISNFKGNREQLISTVSRKLKQLAMSLDIPIIALSQLSRAVEQRPSKRPQLSDLRESGAIEQDADVILFPYRPEYYKIEEWEDGTSTAGQAEIICAKFRGGAVFEEKLKFHGGFQKFMNINESFEYRNPVPSVDPRDAFPKNEDDELDF